MNKPPKYIRHMHKFMSFSGDLVHIDVAKKVFGSDSIIHGAGFLDFSVKEDKLVVTCYGESISLDVEPRWDDEKCLLAPLGINVNPNETFKAKYLLSNGSFIMFSEEMDALPITNVFYCANPYAGYVSFSAVDGKIKIECSGHLEGFEFGSSEIHAERIADCLYIDRKNLA